MQVNEIFFLGSNRYGQAGTGDKDAVRTYDDPRNYDFGVFIKQVSCGYHHSAILTLNGHVYVMGSNIHGTLATKQEGLNYSFSPILVQRLPAISKVESGAFHLCALSTEGTVYSWGRGMDGQLGTGVNKNSYSPEPVDIDLQVIDISCGTNHTLILSIQNTAYAFGNGIYGQLGTGNNKNQSKPKRIDLENVSMVAAGDNHSLYLCQGTMFATGDNTSGQIGIGTSKKYVLQPQMIDLENVTIIQASKFSAAISEQNLYVWGYKSGHFKPHLVESNQKFSEMKCGNEMVILLSSKGSLFNWNISSETSTLNPFNINCRAVLGFSVGENHSIILGDIVRTLTQDQTTPLTLKHFDSFEPLPPKELHRKSVHQPSNDVGDTSQKNKENTYKQNSLLSLTSTCKSFKEEPQKDQTLQMLESCKRTLDQVQELLKKSNKIGDRTKPTKPNIILQRGRQTTPCEQLNQKETTLLIRQKDLVISQLQDELARNQVLILGYEQALEASKKLVEIQAQQLQCAVKQAQ